MLDNNLTFFSIYIIFFHPRREACQFFKFLFQMLDVNVSSLHQNKIRHLQISIFVPYRQDNLCEHLIEYVDMQHDCVDIQYNQYKLTCKKLNQLRQCKPKEFLVQFTSSSFNIPQERHNNYRQHKMRDVHSCIYLF